MTRQFIGVVGIPLLLVLATPAKAAEPAPVPQPAVKGTGIPGSPSETITGVVVKIEGRYYVVKDLEGKEYRFLVSKDTEMAGAFKEGDVIEIQSSPVEHAMAIEPVSFKAEQLEAASERIKGTLVKIESHFYVIKDDEGKEVRLHVSEDTKLPEGLKPGATIEALISPVEHAMFIKAGKRQ